MIYVDQLLPMNREFLLENYDNMRGEISHNDFNNLIQHIAKRYEDQTINVKNISNVMREVFYELDKRASHLSFEKRMDIAKEVIHNVVLLNSSEESKDIIGRSLKLFVELSLESVAEETVSKPQAFSPFSPNRTQKNKETAQTDIIQLPNPKTSAALMRVAAGNSEAIEEQTNEANQYIRETMLDVDKKIAQAQDSIRQCIDQALSEVDVVQDRLEQLVDDVKDWSDEKRTVAAAAIEQFANELIQAIRPKSKSLKEEDIATEKEPLEMDWSIDQVIA